MQKKKISKLEFKKNRIANMNEQDMSAIWGGETYTTPTVTSSVPCLEISYATIAYTVSKISEAIYSMVSPPDPPRKPYTENISDVWIWVEGNQACKINPVDIYGIRS